MSFAAPLVLLGLLPWLAVAWWLLRGRAPRVAVPFVWLWPREAGRMRARRRRLPPRYVTAGVLGALFAVLAGSGPELTAGPFGRRVVVVLADRGATMSAGAEEPRLLQAGRRLAAMLDARDRVEVHFLPTVDPESASGGAGELIDLLAATGPTTASTGDRLAPAARSLLRRAPAIIVLSDRAVAIGPDDERRTARLSPERPVANVALAHIGVDDSGVLVRIERDAPARLAERGVVRLEQIDSDGRRVLLGEADFAVPSAGESIEVIFTRPGGTREAAGNRLIESPLRSLALAQLSALEARVRVAGDEWAGDDLLSLALERPWPAIDAEPGLPMAVARVAATYGELRPARPWSTRVRITSAALGEAERGVVVARGEVAVSAEQVRVVPGDLTRAIDWSRLEGLRGASAGPGPGWQAVVWADDTVLLAMRERTGERAVRQVWVGFDAEALEQRPGFVRFWADVITWTGSGGERWSATDAVTAAALDEAHVLRGIEWTEAGPRATNLPRVDWPAVASEDQARIQSVLDWSRRGLRLGPAMGVLGLGLLGLAAWWWPRRERRG